MARFMCGDNLADGRNHTNEIIPARHTVTALTLTRHNYRLQAQPHVRPLSCFQNKIFFSSVIVSSDVLLKMSIRTVTG